MPDRSVTHSTFVLERNFPATPERVFAAFADPSKKRRWYAEEGSRKVDEFEMEFRVGGRERLRSRLGADTPFPGTPLINETTYQDIVPNRRIVTAYTMTLGDRCISASLVTFELLPAAKGTALVLTHQGAFFEGSDGPERREAGWKQLLEQLSGALAG